MKLEFLCLILMANLLEHFYKYNRFIEEVGYKYSSYNLKHKPCYNSKQVKKLTCQPGYNPQLKKLRYISNKR